MTVFKGTMKPDLWMFTKKNFEDMGDPSGLVLCDARVFRSNDPRMGFDTECCCWKRAPSWVTGCLFRSGNGVNDWRVCKHPMAADLADNPEADLLSAIDEV